MQYYDNLAACFENELYLWIGDETTFFLKKKTNKKQALRDVQSTACLLSSWCVLTRERAITRLKRTIFYFTKFIIEPQQV